MATRELTVGIRELRDHLTRYLARVRRGDRIVVTDRGRPIAAIHAIRTDETLDEKLKRLEAEGKVKLPEKWAPPKGSRVRLGGRPLSEYVLEEREESW